MYSVSPAAGAAWRGLFTAVAQCAGITLDYLDYPAPAPLDALWRRTDLAAVFMCGLPFARAVPRAHALAVPLPCSAEFHGQPHYWSEFVVRADSAFQTVEDTFGTRLALTEPDSQSGCLAVIYALMNTSHSLPLYADLIAPQITPLAVAIAVLEGAADIAPVDAYAWRLLQHYRPDVAAGLRTIGQTAPTAMPLLVSSSAPLASLQQAFIDSSAQPTCRPWLDKLALSGFSLPDPHAYDELAARCEVARRYWHEHPLAAVVHPAFVV